MDDLSFFEYLSQFCFLSIEFHCTFSIIKYYHIFFIIVFRLGSDKLLSLVSSTVFPKGSVTGCDSSLRGGWMVFHFRLFKSICFLLIEIHYTFFNSYIVLTCYVYYYCI